MAIAIVKQDKDFSRELAKVNGGYAPYSRQGIEANRNTGLDKVASLFAQQLAEAGRKEKNDFHINIKLPNSNGYTLPFTGALASEVTQLGMIASLQGVGRMLGYVKKNNPSPRMF
jgi:hypothetical protein